MAEQSSARATFLTQVIKQSIVELKLQAEDSFVLKVVQLEELLQVRHSVFVIGNAGSGKSQARPQHLPVPSRHPPPQHPTTPTYTCLPPSIAQGHVESWRVAANTTKVSSTKPDKRQGGSLTLLPKPISEDTGARG